MAVDFDIRDRIVLLRKDLKKIPADFARGAGMTPATISDIEEGKKGAGSKTLIALANSYGVSLNWLALGIGPTYIREVMPPLMMDKMTVIEREKLPKGLLDLIDNHDLLRNCLIGDEEVYFLIDFCKKNQETVVHFSSDGFMEVLIGHRIAKVKWLKQVQDGSREIGKRVSDLPQEDIRRFLEMLIGRPEKKE